MTSPKAHPAYSTTVDGAGFENYRGDRRPMSDRPVIVTAPGITLWGDAFPQGQFYGAPIPELVPFPDGEPWPPDDDVNVTVPILGAQASVVSTWPDGSAKTARMAVDLDTVVHQQLGGRFAATYRNLEGSQGTFKFQKAPTADLLLSLDRGDGMILEHSVKQVLTAPLVGQRHVILSDGPICRIVQTMDLVKATNGVGLIFGFYLWFLRDGRTLWRSYVEASDSQNWGDALIGPVSVRSADLGNEKRIDGVSVFDGGTLRAGVRLTHRGSMDRLGFLDHGWQSQMKWAAVPLDRLVNARVLFRAFEEDGIGADRVTYWDDRMRSDPSAPWTPRGSSGGLKDQIGPVPLWDAEMGILAGSDQLVRFEALELMLDAADRHQFPFHFRDTRTGPDGLFMGGATLPEPIDRLYRPTVKLDNLTYGYTRPEDRIVQARNEAGELAPLESAATGWGVDRAHYPSGAFIVPGLMTGDPYLAEEALFFASYAAGLTNGAATNAINGCGPTGTEGAIASELRACWAAWQRFSALLLCPDGRWATRLRELLEDWIVSEAADRGIKIPEGEDPRGVGAWRRRVGTWVYRTLPPSMRRIGAGNEDDILTSGLPDYTRTKNGILQDGTVGNSEAVWQMHFFAGTVAAIDRAGFGGVTAQWLLDFALDSILSIAREHGADALHAYAIPLTVPAGDWLDHGAQQAAWPGRSGKGGNYAHFATLGLVSALLDGQDVTAELARMREIRPHGGTTWRLKSD